MTQLFPSHCFHQRKCIWKVSLTCQNHFLISENDLRKLLSDFRKLLFQLGKRLSQLGKSFWQVTFRIAKVTFFIWKVTCASNFPKNCSCVTWPYKIAQLNALSRLRFLIANSLQFTAEITFKVWKSRKPNICAFQDFEHLIIFTSPSIISK